MKTMKLNIQLFGHTNETENYDLPQFIGTDKPTWLGDFNGAMASIDTAIGTNASDITSLGTRVTTAEGVASQASSDVSTLTGTVNTLSGDVTTVTSTANNAQSTATSALNTANTADGKADTNASNIGTLSNLTTTNKTNLVNAINEVNEINLLHATNSGTVTTVQNVDAKISMQENIKLGTKLSISNGGIKIGAGVSYVSAFGSLKYERYASGRTHLEIYKNNSIVNGFISRLGGNWESIATDEVIIPVEENDIIYLYTKTQDAGNALTEYGEMTVQVIK